MSQPWISAGSAIIFPMHKPCYAPRAENSFYKFGKKLMWVSTICAQILRFSRVRVRVRVKVSVSVQGYGQHQGQFSLVVVDWLCCVAILRMNKWFPTSNFAYWTSASRRLILLTARRVPDVQTQPSCYRCSIASSLQITQNSLPHCNGSSSGNSMSPIISIKLCSTSKTPKLPSD